jgi:hypothetical protein
MDLGVLDHEVSAVPKGEWRLERKRAPTKSIAAPIAAPLEVAEAILIQAMQDDTFVSVCLDSGAGESVCPIDAFPSYATKKTLKTGTTYRAAGGQKLENVGEKRPIFRSGGVACSMAFQATTEVKKPLAAAAQLAAKGNRIILDDAESESYIENKKTGARIPLKIENGVYMMEMLVTPFQGQTR